MEFGETLSSSERFNQLALRCLEAEDRVASLVLGDEENLFDPTDVSQEQISEMTATEVFLLDAMYAENALIFLSKEHIAERLSFIRLTSDFVKDFIDESNMTEVRDIFETSEKPITAIIASEHAADFFESIEVFYPLTGEDKFIEKLREAALEMYLVEKGAYASISTKSDEAKKAEIKADFEWSLHDRKDIAIYLSMLAFSTATDKMVENGLIPADNRYLNLNIRQLPETDRIEVILSQGRYQNDDSETTTSIDEKYTDKDGELLVEQSKTTRPTTLGKGVLEKELNIVDPVIAGLLFAWLSYNLEAYQELEAMGSEQLNLLIRQKSYRNIA